MKNWICYNLLGENPETIDTLGFVSGIALLSVLWGSWAFLFIVLPVSMMLGL